MGAMVLCYRRVYKALVKLRTHHECMQLAERVALGGDGTETFQRKEVNSLLAKPHCCQSH